MAVFSCIAILWYIRLSALPLRFGLESNGAKRSDESRKAKEQSVGSASIYIGSAAIASTAATVAIAAIAATPSNSAAMAFLYKFPYIHAIISLSSVLMSLDFPLISYSKRIFIN